VLSWLRNAPGQGFYALDARPTLASGLQPGNLTGLGQAAALDAAARHEMAVVLGLTPMMQMAYQHLGEHGVDWVYYVSARQFIYLYPFTRQRPITTAPTPRRASSGGWQNRQSIRAASG
jgi:hypothetical protein